MHRRTFIAALAALAIASGLLAGCSGAPSVRPTTPAARTPQDVTASASVEGTAASTGATATVVRVRMTTAKGTVDLELYADKAPVTVANFVKLVKARFYDGVLVHRVVPGFVVQAGDPQTVGMSAKRLAEILARQQSGTSDSADPPIGTGGPGWTIPLENTGLTHDRGVIAMARAQDPDSAGSQFYITVGAAHDLDGQYAVFGKVTAGMNVVDRLAVGDIIRSVRIAGE
jgi:cyclophilin family peptidyl-prolyl cis-trans isomerase